jgi:hypothetical protein
MNIGLLNSKWVSTVYREHKLILTYSSRTPYKLKLFLITYSHDTRPINNSTTLNQLKAGPSGCTVWDEGLNRLDAEIVGSNPV